MRNVLTYPLIAVGLGLSGLTAQGVPWPALAGAVAGYAVFAAFGAWHWRTRGTEGLGLGDAKLLAAAGAWLGIAALPWVVLIAALGGLAQVAVARDRRAGIAFGPWLALAFAALWIGRLVA